MPHGWIHDLTLGAFPFLLLLALVKLPHERHAKHISSYTSSPSKVRQSKRGKGGRVLSYRLAPSPGQSQRLVRLRGGSNGNRGHSGLGNVYRVIDASDDGFPKGFDDDWKINLRNAPHVYVRSIMGNDIGNEWGDQDGPVREARIMDPRFPMGISFDREGNLFVCDSLNHRIRRISVSGEVTTFAGGGVVTTVWGKHMEVAHEGFWDGSLTTAKFMGPNGVLVDERRGTIFIADSNNFRIRRIEANSTDVTTLAGRC
eukprot:jgi/Bigna1/143898/aug1.82_g18606